MRADPLPAPRAYGLPKGAVSVLKASGDVRERCQKATEETGKDRPAVPTFRSKHPLTITDNLAGRSFDNAKVARELVFVMGPELLKRLRGHP